MNLVLYQLRSQIVSGMFQSVLDAHKTVGPNYKPFLVTAMLRPVRVFSTAQDGLCFFDNNSLPDEDYQTYSEVVARTNQHTQRLVCQDVRNNVTPEVFEFHRS